MHIDLTKLPREALKSYFFGLRALLDAAVMANEAEDVDAEIVERFTAAVSAEEWREAWNQWRLLDVTAA